MFWFVPQVQRPVVHPFVARVNANNELQARWRKRREAQDVILHDWLAAQTARVAEIALVIDRDRQRELFEAEETARREYLAADHAENERWVKLVSDAQHRANKNEMRKLRRDIERDKTIIRDGLKRRCRGNTDSIPLSKLLK